LRDDFQAQQGGCYTIRSRDGFLFARCPGFRHRPAHADLLHVDLWWRGQNIALDAGTFSYNHDSSSGDPLSKTEAHNTVTIDQSDQMDRVGRFLWLPWARAEARRLQKSDAGNLTYLELTHDGYQRLNAPAVHTRAILRVHDHWLIVDRLTSSAEHEYRLHWLLEDSPFVSRDETHLTLDTSAGPYYVQVGSTTVEQSSSILRADDASRRGWRAPYYNSLEPALSFELRMRAVNAVFWTVFGPESCEVVADDGSVQLCTSNWSAQLGLKMSDDEPLVSSITLSGSVGDKMEID
ncbi:MAG TPA: heparinase II/III-family protein, partial [Blastocatellia bacterium]|nr:heparinase II/III-family protein [Blastocatellia bacterium]